MFSIWALYLLGAATGAWLGSRWGVRGLLLPAGAVAIAVVADQGAPLSIAEEHEEP